MPVHAHDAAELVLVQAGAVEIGVGGRVLRAAEGDLVVLPWGVPHDQRCRRPWRSLCALIRAPAFAEQPRVLGIGLDSSAARLLAELPGLSHQPRPDAGAAVLHAVLRMLDPPAPEARPALPERLQAAVDHLQRDPAARWDPAALQRAACTSSSHLAWLFRRHLGCGPHTYQQRLRLVLAARLLAETRLAVKAVAARCGFDDPNHFSRAFRRLHGHPPSARREPAGAADPARGTATALDHAG